MKKLIILTALSSTVFLGACSILNRPIDLDPVNPGNSTVSIESIDVTVTTDWSWDNYLEEKTNTDSQTSTKNLKLYISKNWETSISGIVEPTYPMQIPLKIKIENIWEDPINLAMPPLRWPQDTVPWLLVQCKANWDYTEDNILRYLEQSDFFEWLEDSRFSYSWDTLLTNNILKQNDFFVWDAKQTTTPTFEFDSQSKSLSWQFSYTCRLFASTLLWDDSCDCGKDDVGCAQTACYSGIINDEDDSRWWFIEDFDNPWKYFDIVSEANLDFSFTATKKWCSERCDREVIVR